VKDYFRLNYAVALPKGYPAPSQIQQSKAQNKVDPIQGKREVDTVWEGLMTWSYPMLLAITAFASCKGYLN